jgi:hypothetical protein
MQRARYVRIHEHLHALVAGLLQEGDEPCEDFRARSGFVQRTDLGRTDDDVTGHFGRLRRTISYADQNGVFGC